MVITELNEIRDAVWIFKQKNYFFVSINPSNIKIYIAALNPCKLHINIAFPCTWKRYAPIRLWLKWIFVSDYTRNIKAEMVNVHTYSQKSVPKLPKQPLIKRFTYLKGTKIDPWKSSSSVVSCLKSRQGINMSNKIIEINFN